MRLLVAAAVFGFLGGIFLIAALVALRRARPLRFALHTLTGLLLLAIGALAGAITVGMSGYRALTREEVAAFIVVRPLGPHAAQQVERPAEGEGRFFRPVQPG